MTADKAASLDISIPYMALICVLAAPFPAQLLANCLRKVAGDGPSAWAPNGCVEHLE